MTQTHDEPQADASTQELFDRCAESINGADGLLITAGAGLGVDSGLPDFRGNQGMWRAYPALGQARIPFERIANPATFHHDPRLAWGFYGHRLKLYRETVPGPAFGVLQDISQHLPHGAFGYTSNVDGHFQKAGFDPHRIVECHGTIHHLQCLAPCSDDIWPADDFVPEIDEETCRLINQMPTCPHCGTLARPNILMFGDWGWLPHGTHHQQRQLDIWLNRINNLLVIEIGAGTSIPTVRRYGERQAWRLIRINPREADVPRHRDISLPLTATTALQSIAARLR